MTRDIGMITDYANDPNAQTAVRHLQGALAHELDALKPITPNPERDWTIKLIIRIGNYLEKQYQGRGFSVHKFVTEVGVSQDEIDRVTKGDLVYLDLTPDEIAERKKFSGLTYPYLTPVELAESRKTGIVYPNLTQADIDKRQNSGLVYPFLTADELASNQKILDAREDAANLAARKLQDAQYAKDLAAAKK